MKTRYTTTKWIMLIVIGLLCSLVPLTAKGSSGGLIDAKRSQSNIGDDSFVRAGAASVTPITDKPDEFFVADSGGNLDTYRFRQDLPNGRYSFAIDIGRYYSPFITPETTTDGFLTPETARRLVSNGLLPEEAILTLYVYDVDHEDTTCSEVDNVYINGKTEPLGTLSSGNNTWSAWSVAVPIENLRFPNAAGVAGSAPAKVANTIEIDVDVSQCDNGGWAVEVAWGMLQIETPIRPLVFVHGWTGDNSHFADFKQYADADGIPSLVPQNYWDGIRSISYTAVKVAQDITATATQYGVSKVNVVAHSKGGLFTRYAIGKLSVAAKVDHFVTLSTPHHGRVGSDTRAAAWEQCDLTKDFTDTRYQLCKSSGYELSPDNIRETMNYTGCKPRIDYEIDENGQVSQWELYYVECQPLWVGYNKDIRYHNIVEGSRTQSSLYIFWFRVVDELTATLPWRANKVPYPTEGNVDALFDDLDHGTIRTDRSVYQCSIHLIEPKLNSSYNCPAGRSSLAQSMADAPQRFASSPSNQIAFFSELSLVANTTNESIINLAGGDKALISIAAQAAVTPVLVDPNGTIIDLQSTLPANIVYTSSDHPAVAGAKLYGIEIANLAAGAWKVRLTAGSSISAALVASVQSTIHLTTYTDRATYSTGQPVTLSAVLLNDTNAVIGSAITGQVTYPNGTVKTVTLNDQGQGADTKANDGLFNVQLIDATTVGVYTVDARASNGNIVRLGSTSFSVAGKSAEYRRVVSSTVTDINRNGLYDTLQFTIQLNILTPGHYAVTGVLVDSANATIATAFTSTVGQTTPLPTGLQNITLAFNGQQIRDHGVDGRYNLKTIILYDENTTTLEIGSVPADVLTSRTYQAKQFEGLLLAFKAANEAVADSNGNGLYDSLTIQVQLDVALPGTYSWNGRLRDANGKEVGWYVGSGSLDANTPATFVFDGTRIGNRMHNGPFTLGDVTIFQRSGGNATGIIPSAYTTIAYSYTQFEFTERKVFLPSVIAVP